MDHRDRAAPVALARNAPVAQAEIDLARGDGAVAAGGVLEPPRDLFLRLLDGHAVEKARIDHAAVAVIGGVGDDEAVRILSRRAHHRRVAEPVFVGEIEVALVVRRAAEDRAGAVVHQDEICDVDRQLPSWIERMDRLDAGVEALLLGGVDDLLRGAVAFAFRDEFGERRILRGCGRGERMIGRERHEFGAEQGVVARGEDLELVFSRRRGRRIEREADMQSLRAADPVALHDAHFLRPAVEAVERLQQILGKFGDAEVPLRHLALLDQRARAPAAAVDHLLVGEHGAIDRIPVHLAELALDQARAQEVEEHLLLVLVVGRVAGRDLARPVERQPHRLELRLHRRDVLVGPRLRMDLALHGGVLRRHAEGVPAHGMQHVETHGALVARDHVAHRVVAHVPHMDAPRWIGEHLQHVVFRARVVVAGGEDAPLVPDFLPTRLGLAGVVAFGGHWLGRRNPSCSKISGATRKK